MQHTLPFLIETPETDPPGLKHRERRILLAGKILPYTLRRSTRRSIGIAVDENGLHAAAPYWVRLEEIEAFMREKQRWILRSLSEAHRRIQPAFVWQEGARLPYFGRDIGIAITNNKAIVLRDDALYVGLADDATPARLRESVINWLNVQGLDFFRRRMEVIAPRLGVEVPPLGLSRARTQWGNCARKTDGSTRVLLNWKLVHYEAHLIDYVITHELAHLRHMNHSAAFWRTVGRAYPGYEAARRELRQRAHWAPEL